MEYNPRKIDEKLEFWLRRKEYIIIRGPRQSGKTTTLLYFKEKTENSEYISLEDENWRKILEEDAKKFAELILSRGKRVLFLDEAQYVKEIGKKLKYIYDFYGDKLKIVATGSGSFDIKVEIGKHLVGRALYLELLPLSFEEFLMWKAKDLYKIFVEYLNSFFEFLNSGKLETNLIFEKEFLRYLEEYIIFGSFPAIVKEENYEVKKELLKNLVTTYVERDVFYFLGIRNIDKFLNLMKVLSYSIGNLISPFSLSQDLKIDFKTLEKYLEILKQTYLISLIPPFYKNLITEIKKSKKVYFLDLGIVNYLLKNFNPLDFRSENEIGKLIENFIFIQLRNYFENIYFWRTTAKAEIDFIVLKDDKIIPIEVKFKDYKLSKGFYSFLKTYKPNVAIVFTLGKFGVEKIYETNVAYIPHYFI